MPTCQIPSGHGPPLHTDLDALDLRSLDTDLDVLDRDGVVAVLAAARRARSRLDTIEVRAHRRLRQLEAVGAAEPAAAAVAHAANGDGRHGRSVSERDELCLDAPDVEDALEVGALSGAHLDAINAACRHLPTDVRAEFLGHIDTLTGRAGRLSLDAFRRECRRLAKHLLAHSGRGSEVDELERQRAASKVTRWTDRSTGMCATLIELDPVRDAQMSSAVRAEIARLRGTDGNGELTWRQLELTAWVNCVAGSPTSPGDTDDTCGARVGPASRQRVVDRAPQIIAVADVALLRRHAPSRGAATATGDQRCETSDGTELPVATLRRLCCEAEIIPVVLDGPSRVLDVGRSRRTATAEQRHALRALHRTCTFPGCGVPFESCRVHHVDHWVRDIGPTDLDNLVPVCERHHHHVHEGGWTLSLDADRVATWTRPDGTVHHRGPSTDRHGP